jgi:hypothetical protein
MRKLRGSIRAARSAMWQHVVLASILVCLLACCAASTGILPAGPDTYTVTERFAPARGGGTEAQRVAMTEANNFCEQQERKFFPLNMGEAGRQTGSGPTGYFVTFRCLAPGDPELTRPRFQQVPDDIIEQRNR